MTLGMLQTSCKAHNIGKPSISGEKIAYFVVHYKNLTVAPHRDPLLQMGFRKALRIDKIEELDYSNPPLDDLECCDLQDQLPGDAQTGPDVCAPYLSVRNLF